MIDIKASSLPHFATATEMRSNQATLMPKKAPLTLAEIENLFIEKLNEKIVFSKREIQKLFKRYDSDNSGFLSVTELQTLIHCFLNAIDRQRVAELVQHYDVDNDGLISIVEFTSFLLSRQSADKKEWLTIDHLQQNKGENKSDKENPASDEGTNNGEIGGRENTTNPQSLGYRSRVFLQMMKSILMRLAREARLEHKPHSGVGDSLTVTGSAYTEQTARAIIFKSFQPFVNRGTGTLVDLTNFTRVLGKFVYPGAIPLRDDVARFLFTMCCSSPEDSVTHDTHARTAAIADPDILIDIIFEKDSDRTNKWGFRQPVQASSSTGRPDVAVGPPIKNPGTLPIQISEVPYKFVTRRSHTALAAPSDFDVRFVVREGEREGEMLYIDIFFVILKFII